MQSEKENIGISDVAESLELPTLVQAAQEGKCGIVKFLMLKGADINTTRGQNCTPLMAAIWGQHEAMVVELLRHGPIVDWQDEHGRTSLWWAAHDGSEPIVVMLLASAEADPNMLDFQDVSPKAVARTNDHPSSLRML